MRSGFLPARVVHVHPTRTCNLACAHCYSASSPSNTGALDPGSLLEALEVLRSEGYEVLSVSGGEPLVYRGLTSLLRGAAELGYRNHLVTNGLLLTRARLKSLGDTVHLVAVSFDGARESHTRVRGREDAFTRANAALEVLSAGSIPFALAFGVSRFSLPDIPWAFERAREVGAAVLHLRPLVQTGRGASLSDDWMLSPEDCERVVVLRDLLDSGCGSGPRVQVDLLDAADVECGRSQFPELLSPSPLALMSDLVNPLVIDELGRLLPFTYGVHENFAIESLSPDLQASISTYKATGGAPALALLRAAFADAQTQAFEYMDWFGHLTNISQQMGSSVRRSVELESVQ